MTGYDYENGDILRFIGSDIGPCTVNGVPVKRATDQDPGDLMPGPILLADVKSRWKLWLDDLRNPPGNDWVVARSYDEAVHAVEQRGFPGEFSLDHDLGEDTNGLDFLSWLLFDYRDPENPKPNFIYTFHTANPVGKQRMETLINAYLWYPYEGEGQYYRD